MNEGYLWYWSNAKKVKSVGTKRPNQWGIYDTLGNVSEYMYDWASKTRSVDRFQFNPKGKKKGTRKIIKGGNWYSSGKEVTILNRESKKIDSKGPTIGFRIVINLKKEIKK